MAKREEGPNRVPRLSSASELDIPWSTLETLIGGRSVVDLQQLPVADDKSVGRFLQAYGFDPTDASDCRVMEQIHARAIRYLDEVVLPWQWLGAVPEPWRSMPIEDLLAVAARPPSGEWPNWPCVLLKVLHCTTHAMFSQDTEAHQAALKSVEARFLPFLFEQSGQQWIGDEHCKIPLVDFHIKDEKPFERIMTKLLHKPGNLALEVFDRLGVRLVTHDIFSAVLLIKFLRSRNIIMFANQLPERSRNSLAELDEIHRLYGVSAPPFIVEQPAGAMLPSPELSGDNPFSDRAFRMFKFVERLIVRLPDGRRSIYPYEIQLLDCHAWEATFSGDATHSAYEARQLKRVRQRLFGHPVQGA
ncbi:TIGR04552 family protein [Marinobacterium rhizophilum]|uniref:TIGR04552 family protein n=1 Tax=Marinobacterium rhizophilum TaxID=420402 RepID=A0ABY5HR38_9GAMM|nr:TIGR04552 family protein [Marinobacterium rhizophilum]UTW14028.1 TIGR04552 family protein [Marinobacterium rhizophilum]